MTKEIQNFITYMCEVKQISKNTELSYERDLRKMSVFLQEQGVASVSDVTSTNLNAYIFWLLTKKELCKSKSGRRVKGTKD